MTPIRLKVQPHRRPPPPSPPQTASRSKIYKPTPPTLNHHHHQADVFRTLNLPFYPCKNHRTKWGHLGPTSSTLQLILNFISHYINLIWVNMYVFDVSFISLYNQEKYQ
ncbi:hypothetical protein QVD17_01286 [Tagetes erecta]|uniref:Uncharacterized protein n=1 Tax=Tagetes erecta TaxID=13708 RepID=A0AAD8LAD1_TARER|nr:hypothetical protein QVD17_01286 [Tagetes erecta]